MVGRSPFTYIRMKTFKIQPQVLRENEQPHTPLKEGVLVQQLWRVKLTLQVTCGGPTSTEAACVTEWWPHSPGHPTGEPQTCSVSMHPVTDALWLKVKF